MARCVNVQLGTRRYATRREALRRLAQATVPEAAAGQRGQRLSRLFQLLADAYQDDPQRVTRAVAAIIKPGDA